VICLQKLKVIKKLVDILKEWILSPFFFCAYFVEKFLKIVKTSYVSLLEKNGKPIIITKAYKVEKSPKLKV